MRARILRGGCGDSVLGLESQSLSARELKLSDSARTRLGNQTPVDVRYTTTPRMVVGRMARELQVRLLKPGLGYPRITAATRTTDRATLPVEAVVVTAFHAPSASAAVAAALAGAQAAAGPWLSTCRNSQHTRHIKLKPTHTGRSGTLEYTGVTGQPWWWWW